MIDDRIELRFVHVTNDIKDYRCIKYLAYTYIFFTYSYQAIRPPGFPIKATKLLSQQYYNMQSKNIVIR